MTAGVNHRDTPGWPPIGFYLGTYFPSASRDLLSDLVILQQEEGLTPERMRDAHVALRVCGETVQTAEMGRQHVISALEAMQDSPGGSLLYALFNVDGRQPPKLNDRRRSYVNQTHAELDQILDLENEATKELALRLLGKYYTPPKGAPQNTEERPEYVVSSLDLTCRVRDRRVLDTEQDWTVIPLIDGARYFEHTSLPNVQLKDVRGGKVVQSTVTERGSVHTITFPEPLSRGREYKFRIREGSVVDRSEHLPKEGMFSRDFHRPVLQYRVRMQFAGEQPAKVWTFGNLPPDRAPGSPKRQQHITRDSRDPSKYHSVEFDDRCNGLSSGVAWQWREPKRIVLIFALIFLIAAALDWPALAGQSGNVAHVVSVAIFVALACVGIAMVCRYCAARNGRDFKNSHRYTELKQLPDSIARNLQRAAATNRAVRPLQAAIFSRAILRPRQFRQRVVETYEPGHRSVKQRVTVEVQIPRDLLPANFAALSAKKALRAPEPGSGVPEAGSENSNPFVVYFPVMLPAKSTFQDHFQVLGDDGCALLTLSYREYLQLTAAVLRLLLASAYNDGTAGKSIPPDIKEAELNALRLISSRRTAEGVAPDINLDYRWLETLEPSDEDRDAIASKESVIDFVEMLTSHYAIVIMVRPDEYGRFRFTYEQTLIPDLKLPRGGRLRVMLGARPIELSINIKTASTCQSYHLNVNGVDDGLYLTEQELVDSTQTLRGTALEEIAPPHYRFRRRLGQPHAHFYSRFFPEPAPAQPPCPDGRDRVEQPSVRLRYHETPPGSLLRAAVSAVACMLLVTIVGIVSTQNPDPGTDAPAFLLVFPGLVAAWLGFESPSRRLLEGTLTARFSLLITVVTSVSASGLFMAHRALPTKDYEWWRLPTEWSLLWISDVSWLGTTIVATANAIAVTYQYIRQTAYFAYLADRRHGSGVQQHG